MNGREIIKTIMKQAEVSNADMAHRLNISQAALWDRLNNKKVKDIPSSLLCDMLAILDYDVVIVPRGKGSRIEGSYPLSSIPKKETSVNLDELLADDSPVVKTGKGVKIKLSSNKEEV